jgi:biotin carboxyl carrier protein
MNSYIVTINGKEQEINVSDDGRVTANGSSSAIDVQQIDERTFSLLIDGESHRVVAEQNGDTYQVLVNGTVFEVLVESERARLLKKLNVQSTSGHIKTEIRAPMPALVTKVEVEIGQEVKPGHGLLILEAMKMENEIKSHSAGVVREIYVQKGKAVEKNELLILLE